MLERDFAAAAGIGWHGKSTMLLNRSFGTWFFLAEILTTLESAARSAAGRSLRSCTRCIDACPTGAITAPHQLDARRCISYLTIELKGSIPLELRPLIGDRIYGCDDCLEACPGIASRRFRTRALSRRGRRWRGWRCAIFSRSTTTQFREMFRGSPIKRIKRRGFLRNVCVALGNVGTEEDLPALETAARDPRTAHRRTCPLGHRSKSSSTDRAQTPVNGKTLQRSKEPLHLWFINRPLHASSRAAPRRSSQAQIPSQTLHFWRASAGSFSPDHRFDHLAANANNRSRSRPKKRPAATSSKTVSATGKVQPETEVKISPEVAGEIIELPVADGKEVKKGDMLMKIRPDSYKALLEQQQAAISTAEAVSGQQKASMEKAEQDLRSRRRIFSKRS